MANPTSSYYWSSGEPDGPGEELRSSSTQRMSAPSATSQGFHPPPEPRALKRSLWLSGWGSGIGALFFAAVQGSVFNFFIEDLGLKHKLGFFMGLASLAGLGSLAGSWFKWETNAGKYDRARAKLAEMIVAAKH